MSSSLPSAFFTFIGSSVQVPPAGSFSRRSPPCPIARCPWSITRRCRTHVASLLENNHDSLLGGRPCYEHATLRAARWIRSWHRHPFRWGPQRRGSRDDDERDHADLGRQRDLARR